MKKAYSLLEISISFLIISIISTIIVLIFSSSNKLIGRTNTESKLNTDLLITYLKIEKTLTPILYAKDPDIDAIIEPDLQNNNDTAPHPFLYAFYSTSEPKFTYTDFDLYTDTLYLVWIPTTKEIRLYHDSSATGPFKTIAYKINKFYIQRISGKKGVIKIYIEKEADKYGTNQKQKQVYQTLFNLPYNQ